MERAPIPRADAAATIRTTEVWPGGASGYNLSGVQSQFARIAIWDAGLVRETHQEFGGRVSALGPGLEHPHSTHVAGTMIAAVCDPMAKGMSYTAELRSYFWQDDTHIMAQQGGLGLPMSNHSYGFVMGWR